MIIGHLCMLPATIGVSKHVTHATVKRFQCWSKDADETVFAILGWLVGWTVGFLAGRLVGRLVSRLIGWLVGWLQMAVCQSREWRIRGAQGRRWRRTDRCVQVGA